MRKNLINKVLGVLLIAYSIFIVFSIAIDRNHHFWDFKAYYYSAKAFQQGVNPYLPSEVSKIAKSDIRLTYPYPPVTLLFFKLFLLFNYSTAYFLFLSLNCILVIWLIHLWTKEFLEHDVDILFYIFCLLAFNGAIYRGFRSGNFVIIEQSLICLALFLFLRKNLLGFCTVIIIAASFKLQPVLFLFMLFLSDYKKRYLYFIYSLIIFLVILAVSYLLYPSIFLNFVHFVFHIDERGQINPSTLSLIRDLFQLAKERFKFIIPAIVPLAVYCSIILGIIFVTLRSFRMLILSKVKNKEKIIVFLFCVMYSLILPRSKDYAYILLLVPSYFIIKKAVFIKTHFLYFIFILLPCIYVSLPGFSVSFNFLWNYYSLIIAYFIWALYVWGFIYRQDIFCTSQLRNRAALN